jgi:hypothetical protein
MKNAIMVATKIKSSIKSLLRLLAEARIKPVHTENEYYPYDDKFAHITLLT